MRINFSVINIKSQTMNRRILTLIALLFSVSVKAQDPRISQFMEIPMTINPAHTGNFKGLLRVGTLYNHAGNGSIRNNFYGALTNNLYNVSVDYKVCKRQHWGVGFNYMRTGSSVFIMSGNHLAFSLSRVIRLDSAQIHKLRVGLQAAYVNGHVDETKGSYSILLDVGSFHYYRPKNTVGLLRNQSDYVNFGLGALYQYSFQKIRIEAGASLNNILKPDFGIMYNDASKKRLRASFTTSISFDIDEKNSIRLDHLSWKEGLYLRGPKIVSDSANISELLYGLSWSRNGKTPLITGLYSRSAKTIIGVAGVRFTSKCYAKMSYELPFNLKSYPVSQYGFSFNYIFSSKQLIRKKRSKPAED